MRLPRGWIRPVTTYAAGLVLLAPLVACSADPAGPSADASPSTDVPTGAPSAPTDQPSDEPSGQPTDPSTDPSTDPGPEDTLPPVRDPQSLPALMREKVRGGGEACRQVTQGVGDAQDLLPPQSRSLIDGQRPGPSDVSLRGSGCEGGHRRLGAVPVVERTGHLVGRWGA